MTTRPAATDPLAELVRLDRLGLALAEATGDDRWRSCTAELISRGKSNITFTVRSDAGELVARRGLFGGLPYR